MIQIKSDLEPYSLKQQLICKTFVPLYLNVCDLSVIKNIFDLCCFNRKSKNDTWVSNNMYWQLRGDPGFSKIDFPVLW